MTNGSTKSKDSEKQNITSVENENQSTQNDNWKYSSETTPGTDKPKIDDSFEDINWSASEFIAHDKNVAWYAVLSILTLIVAAVVYLLTHDILSTIIILLAGVIFGVYGARKPRLLNYKLDNSGLTIQTRLFNYDSLKSFIVIENSPIPNIILLPLKRFMPSMSIYLDPSSSEEVIRILSAHLPQDLDRQDLVERFMLRIRF